MAAAVAASSPVSESEAALPALGGWAERQRQPRLHRCGLPASGLGSENALQGRGRAAAFTAVQLRRFSGHELQGRGCAAPVWACRCVCSEPTCLMAAAEIACFLNVTYHSCGNHVK